MIVRRIALVPQYMHDFKCIGSECPDTCCAGWRVDIDRDTYKKYRNCPNPELKNLLTKKVTRNRSNSSDMTYAKIKLENNLCPFLGEDKLCEIQKELGEAYLSYVCATYPRTANNVNGTMEVAATPSCPEVARLALLNPHKMEFDETWHEDGRIKPKRVINTHAVTASNSPIRYFWELRIFSIGLLQNRDYELWERLIILGLFYKKVQEYVDQKRNNEIVSLIASYMNLISRMAHKTYIQNLPHRDEVQFKLLWELAQQRLVRGISNAIYLQRFKEFLQGMGLIGEVKKEQAIEKYQEVYTSYYQPYMKNREYILENYLVNYVFKNLFPFGNEAGLFDDYVMLVIHYALIKMHLIGLAGFYKEEFNEEHILSLIWSFSRVVEHNPAYLRSIHDLLRANGFTTLAYMAILVKNG